MARTSFITMLSMVEIVGRAPAVDEKNVMSFCLAVWFFVTLWNYKIYVGKCPHRGKISRLSGQHVVTAWRETHFGPLSKNSTGMLRFVVTILNV